eukprot:Hpha_TRINITY_DN27691_c0_g1::TRINITY_DN27691_c0_g1_i1::g.57420::m.57420
MAITERAYRSGDSEACKGLEKKARQGKRWAWLSKLLDVVFRLHFVHHAGFDEKARQYENHVIRVAEDSDTAQIVGVVCVGIKRVVIRGETFKAAMIFDLRVDETYQGKGIGRLLSTAAEAESTKHGVDFWYLSVNGDNTKAKTLYKSLGYHHASTRNPAVEILFRYDSSEAPPHLVKTTNHLAPPPSPPVDM